MMVASGVNLQRFISSVSRVVYDLCDAFEPLVTSDGSSFSETRVLLRRAERLLSLPILRPPVYSHNSP